MRLFFGLFSFKITVFLLAIAAGIMSVFIGNMVAIYDGLEKGNQRMERSMHDNARKMRDYTPPK